jgi:hypothetical protein
MIVNLPFSGRLSTIEITSTVVVPFAQLGTHWSYSAEPEPWAEYEPQLLQVIPLIVVP